MDLNLDTLKQEIVEYLEHSEFAIFRSAPGGLEGPRSAAEDGEFRMLEVLHDFLLQRVQIQVHKSSFALRPTLEYQRVRPNRGPMESQWFWARCKFSGIA